MKSNFGFLLFNEFEDMDFVGPWEVIACWCKSHGGPENFFTVSETTKKVKSVNELIIQPHFSFAQCPPLDYLLIPGGEGIKTEIHNKNLLAFVKKQAPHCQHILSVCTGTFLLYAAGLLQGKKATTHWAYMECLKMLPDIIVTKERYVRDGNIWTSAGISSGIDLAFAFLAFIASEEVAGRVQLQTEYYPIHKIYKSERPMPAYVRHEKKPLK